MPRDFEALLADVDYPTTDGNPMAETDLHRILMMSVIDRLAAYFAPRGDVYVSGNLMVYYEEGEPRTFEALQIGDTMTDPAVRHVGRGPTSLLGRTMRYYYARFCETQVDFNYGINTGNIQRFSMAFVGARRLEDLPFHVLEVAAGPRAPGGGLRARLAGWSERRADRFDEGWDELFARVAPAYGMLVERDARYLDWRYRQCPDANYVVSACFRRGRLVVVAELVDLGGLAECAHGERVDAQSRPDLVARSVARGDVGTRLVRDGQ